MDIRDPSSPFASPVALREGNRRLLEQLERYGDDDFPASFLDEIERFRARAAATGAILSSLDERGEAQSFINFWLTILFNGSRRPNTILLGPFDGEAARARAGDEPPYKGLDAFQAEDRGAFFGRAAAVKAMLDRLLVTRLLAVTGLSGSGKSSVVRAGLIPQLADGALVGSEEWTVLGPMVPGRDPVGVLGEMTSGPGGRLTAPGDLAARLDEFGGPVFLILDQFEEVFTLCPNEDDRRLVLASLANAAGPGSRHFVVLTMRSEYDSRVEIDTAFAELFAAGRIHVGALSARELRTAIEQPAAQVGVTFEDGLAEELVQHVLGEAAGLPLLQFTLLELWKRRDDHHLTWKAYNDLGGRPREVLARRATEIYEAFQTPHDRVLSRRIFLALAEIGAGLEATSRRVARAELDNIGSRDSVDDVLRVWQVNGLVRIAPAGSIGPLSQVEVAHEALIRNWDLLVSWIEDHFAETRRRRVLTEQARAWRAGSKALLGELSLKEADQLVDLDPDERAYIAASRAEVDRQNSWRRRLMIAAVAGAIVSMFGTVAATVGYLNAEKLAAKAAQASHRAKLASTAAMDARAFARKTSREAEEAATTARHELFAARRETEQARAELTMTRRMRDSLLAQQKAISTQTAAAAGNLAQLQGKIETTTIALKTAEATLKTAEATLLGKEADLERAKLEVAVERSSAQQLASKLQDSALGGLRPEAVNLATRLIAAARAQNIDLRITGGYRSLQQQEELFARGRTAPGPRVTNARVSIHSTGLAFDIAVLRNGSLVFDDTPAYRRVGRLGQELGLVWGGAYPQFPDFPHFETADAGAVLREMRARASSGDRD